MTGFSSTGIASGFAGVDGDGNPSGDLTGSYPNPLVKGLWDNPIDPRTPSNGDTLIYNGGEWIPTPSPASTTVFQGVWDANTNTPDIANYPGLSDGYVWIVGVSGTTNVGGISTWDLGDYAVYSGGNWYRLSNSSFGWRLSGNAGTNPTVNYMGTTDAHDFSIRANAIEGLRILTTGDVNAAANLKVVLNITGTNIKACGDVAINGGDLTSTSTTFNLLSTPTTINMGAGATTRVTIGNSAGCNVISGSTKLPQGISGSLTRLADGTSAFVAGSGMLISSVSNGAVTYTVDDSKFAALTGSVFSGPVQFNVGLSGSLTNLSDGTSYLRSGDYISISSASNGAVTISGVGIAPVGSAYVTIGNDATLTGERALATGVGLTLSDGGANASVTLALSNTGSAGTYGAADSVPIFSTDAQGRVTSATTTPIAISASQIVSGTFPSTVSVQNIYQNVTSQVSGGSAALVYGEVIYFTTSGGSASNPAINRASAASASTAATTIGLVSSTTIPNGTAGQIITRGVLVGNPLGSPPYLNTNGFTQGDLLYVDPTTPGALTNVRPSYPNFAIPVGIVIVKNQYTGAIYVDPSVGYNAADIVKITSPSAKRTESAPATTTILSTWFNGPPAISYLVLDFSGAGNVTLSTGPIQAQTAADYGRVLWIHNVSTKTVTFNSGGTVYLSGGVNLVLQPNSLVQFMWSFVGGGVGRWLQMGAPITVS